VTRLVKAAKLATARKLRMKNIPNEIVWFSSELLKR
jgi:hypothetical protein